jgi:hypothetical protein
MGWYLSGLIVVQLPEGTNPGFFAEINAVLGILVGWIVAGSRAGGGQRAAIGYGLTAMAALLFWAVFLHSAIAMVENSLKKYYDGPVEALIAVFELMVENGQLLLDPQILIAIGVGALVGGLVTEFFGQRYP